MSDVKPTLIVLAAGMGSRYGGLKQIDPVGPSGEVVMDYAVYDALDAGFGKVVFLIRKDIEAAFREVIEPRYAGRIPIEFAFQELDDLPGGRTPPEGRTKPWGTAHAVLCCREVVKEPFAVLNADDFYGRQSFHLLGDKLRAVAGTRGQYALVGFQLDTTLSDHGGVSRGICEVDGEGRLTEVIETHGIRSTDDGLVYDENSALSGVSGREPVSMNMWGFTPDFFATLEENFGFFLDGLTRPEKEECYIPTAVDQMIKSGAANCEVLPSAEQWQGVTYPEDKPMVMAAMQVLVDEGVYPTPLWSAP